VCHVLRYELFKISGRSLLDFGCCNLGTTKSNSEYSIPNMSLIFSYLLKMYLPLDLPSYITYHLRNTNFIQIIGIYKQRSLFYLCHHKCTLRIRIYFKRSLCSEHTLMIQKIILCLSTHYSTFLWIMYN